MLISALLMATQSVTPGVYEPRPLEPQPQQRRRSEPEVGSIERAQQDRFNACMDMAIDDSVSAIVNANQWMREGGSFHARHCLGFAYAREQKWGLAVAEFEKAAREADGLQDKRGARLWAQAGNAALANGEPLRAISFIDTALANDNLQGMQRGEAHMDRGRALVAADREEDARAEFDKAHELVPEDPMGWLLSATLARRNGDLDRALEDITVAAQLAPQDADIALEAGNIAVKSGDWAAARANWEQAVAIKRDSSAANTARQYLLQLDELEREGARQSGGG